VQHYLKYRPAYPRAVLDLLAHGCGLTPADVVADVGSGTGLLSKLFLENGNRVYGVEPNEPMRLAGEQLLGHWDTFTSLPGSAEHTGLDDHSVDLVVAGQAFHWFDVPIALVEFTRVLRSGGRLALIWNQRDTKDPLQRGYDALFKQHVGDYKAVCHHRLSRDEIARIFGRGDHIYGECPNEQVVDRDSLLGRAASASYFPQRGQPGHEAMVAGLEALFDEHEAGGVATLRYRTMVHAGRMVV